MPLDSCFGLLEPRCARELDQALDHETLRLALRRLSEAQRQVITLRFLQGLSTIETARILARSPDAVKKLQARGLEALRGLLDPRAPGLAA